MWFLHEARAPSSLGRVEDEALPSLPSQVVLPLELSCRVLSGVEVSKAVVSGVGSFLILGTMFDLVESKFACDPGCSIRVLSFRISTFLLACFCGVDLLRFLFGVGSLDALCFIRQQLATFFR
jgi:hypothetical protein